MTRKPKTTIKYEQCPWDPDHVSAIYRGLVDLRADGEWHPNPANSAWLYRVWNGEIFQFVANAPDHPAFEWLISQPAPLSDEDSEWEIAGDPSSCLSIGSIFSMTFGQYDGIEAVEAMLDPYGVGFQDLEGRNFLVAFFSADEPGAWLDAMERLRYFEGICLEANRAVVESLNRVWLSYAPVLEVSPSVRASEEIAPLPSGLRRGGPKNRQPIE